MRSSVRSTTGTTTDTIPGSVETAVFPGLVLGSIRVPWAAMSANLGGSGGVVHVLAFAAERHFGDEPKHEEIERGPDTEETRSRKNQRRRLLRPETSQA